MSLIKSVVKGAKKGGRWVKDHKDEIIQVGEIVLVALSYIPKKRK